MGFIGGKGRKLACQIFDEELKKQTKSLFEIKYGVEDKKINFIKILRDYFIVRGLLEKSH